MGETPSARVNYPAKETLNQETCRYGMGGEWVPPSLRDRTLVKGFPSGVFLLASIGVGVRSWV